MDEAYLAKRVCESLAMATAAAGSAARLIHLELAGRYSLAAAGYAGVDPREPRAVTCGNASSFLSRNAAPAHLA